MRSVLIFLALALTASYAFADEVAYGIDGETFSGYYAPADNPRGLVLIVHDWDGLTDYERRRADMLAEAGYDAFTLDMFGEQTPTQTVEHRRAATGALYANRERMRTLLYEGLAQARARSSAEGLVVMGYCFGGAVTLEMARSERADQAAGYATFHGGLATPEGQTWSGDEPPILVMHGGADRSVTVNQVVAFWRELESAGTPYTIEVYSGAPHGFSVFDSSRYHERADTESWEAFMDFLDERLAGG